MSLVCWKCRGLGNLSVVPILKFIVQHYKLDILFLSGPLVHINKMEEFCYLLDFDFALHLKELAEEEVSP